MQLTYLYQKEFGQLYRKEFGQQQPRGSGDDLLIICKDSTKAGKKNTFAGGCKNFPTIGACTSHESGGSQSYSKVWLQQQHFKARSDNASKMNDDSLKN